MPYIWSKINMPYNWTPRPYQRDAWNYLRRGGKRIVMNWHRRSGKDDLLLNFTACASMRRVGTYWYLLPAYAQARKSTWDAVNPHTGVKRLDQAFPESIRSATHQNEMKITLKNGSVFQLMGSDNYDGLVGSAPAGLVFSEYAISNPSAWAYLSPIVEENNGWAAMNSTPRGKNHFKKITELAQQSKDWFYDRKTADDTCIFDRDQLTRIRDELISIHGPDFGNALFQQEYYVSFDAAVLGSVWGDCIEQLRIRGRIGDFPWLPSLPVHVAYDLGSTDATAIWFFQVTATDIYIINHHESHHKSINYYCNLLRQYSNEYGYVYGTQWLPHDARACHLAAGGKSILQQFIDEAKDNKIGKIKMVPNLSIQHGIQAARATFPRMYFNESLVSDGLECLLNYSHYYDDTKKCYSANPIHDYTSHSADALRYLSLVWREARITQPVLSAEKSLLKNNIDAVPFKKIINTHLKNAKNKQESML